MKFIKNHNIIGLEPPFLEMEILPLIENYEEAKEYAASIGKKVGYYSTYGFKYRVPSYLNGAIVEFIGVGKDDTYEII